MSDLSPCPFCGSDDVEAEINDQYIECLTCGAQGPVFDGLGLVDAWNARYNEEDEA